MEAANKDAAEKHFGEHWKSLSRHEKVVSGPLLRCSNSILSYLTFSLNRNIQTARRDMYVIWIVDPIVASFDVFLAQASTSGWGLSN